MAAEPKPGKDREPAGGGPNASADWAGFATVGFEFVVAILVPGALGWWVDRKFGTAPWAMLGGGLLGFVIGLRQLMRAVNKSSKR